MWVDVSGRRMFVVGFTPGGAPYGIFEDEIDVDADGPDRTAAISLTDASTAPNPAGVVGDGVVGRRRS